MSVQSLKTAFENFQDRDGSPLENGYIYIGTAGLDAVTNAKAVYWDAAKTLAVSQPVRTSGGYPLNNGALGEVYVDGDYSLTIKDKNQALIYSNLNRSNRESSDIVNYDLPVAGAVQRTLTARLQDYVSVKDFGAIGNGSTDDTAAIQACVTYVYTKAATDALTQRGGIVYFPAGRYLISASITGVTNGITIEGEPSGLASVPLASASSGSQIICDTSASSFPIFTVTDGGPITIKDIALNGTSGATTSVAILSGDGTTSAGITQGHFFNVRFTGFTSVFSCSKLADCSFDDCGFEYNTTCFNLIGGSFTAFSGLKFSSCIFFGGSSRYFSLSAAASVDDITFSSCIFKDDPAQVIQCEVFSVSDATLKNATFSACTMKGQDGDSFLKSQVSTSSMDNILITGCIFNTMDIVTAAFSSPLDQMTNIIVNGCTITNSNFTSAFEVEKASIVNNIFIGTSAVIVSGCNDLIVIANDFKSASVNPPIVLTDVHDHVIITGNIFADDVVTLPINSSSTKVDISKNQGGAIKRTNTFTTLTAGSGGWTNGTKTPQFFKDDLGYICMRGDVNNSSPGSSSIIGSTPSGFRADVAQRFICPGTSSNGYIFVLANTDGNIYSLAKSGSDTVYDLSPIRFHSL